MLFYGHSPTTATDMEEFHPHKLLIDFRAIKLKDTDQGFCDTPGMLNIWAHGVECSAYITLPQPAFAREHWSIGFLQTVTGTKATHKYGTVGRIERLVHPLVSQRQLCVNDSDGSAMPFFDDSGSKVDISPGPIRNGTWVVGYQDWPDSKIENDYPPLTSVERKCEYRVWLVAIRWSPERDGPHPKLRGSFRPGKDHVTVLGHCTWNFHLSCRLNPMLPIGRRVINFSFDYEDEPVMLPKYPLPLSALSLPTYAASIASVWIPDGSDSHHAYIRQYPTHIVIDWETWKRELLPNFVWFSCDEAEDQGVKIVDSCGVDRLLKKPSRKTERRSSVRNSTENDIQVCS